MALDQRQIQVLKALARRDAACRRTISEETGLSAPGVGNTLTALERYGYAARVGVIEHPRYRYALWLFAATPTGYDVAAAS
jgi:DNA-binding IclR family transcriptional regulator